MSNEVSAQPALFAAGQPHLQPSFMTVDDFHARADIGQGNTPALFARAGSQTDIVAFEFRCFTFCRSA